jgi:hypothetical protein
MILLLEVFREITKKIVFTTVFFGFLSILYLEPLGAAVRVKIPRATAPDVSRHKVKPDHKGEYSTSFHVVNKLGRPVFVVPFAYLKRFTTDPWHWEKMSILELGLDQAGLVEVGSIPTADDLTTVFGCVRICDTKQEAEDATYQLTLDTKKIDLDLLALLHGKSIVLHSSLYGVEGERLSYETVPSRWTVALAPLDFLVLNKSSTRMFVTSFFYGKEQDADEFAPWRFSKSPVYKLEPEQSTLIKVETIKDPYDRGYLRGYLGVFGEDEASKAENSTYELLTPDQKRPLGPLALLKDKHVIVTSRAYGSDILFDVATRQAPKNGAANLMAAV